MVDDFPEAFARFENDVDISETGNWHELVMQFKHWSGKRWKGTPLQMKALRIEAEERGIRYEPQKIARQTRYPERYVPERHVPERYFPERHVNREVFTRRGRQTIVYRDPRSGRFARR